jgi:chromosome segregation ATPase
LDNYEHAFAKIQQVTNCDNIGELVKRFTQMEDQNFSLFNYVNELNNQTGAVEEETARVEQLIAEWNNSNSNVEEENKQVLKELEDKLKATTEATELFESQYNSMTALLSDLEKGVERLLQVVAPNATALATGENALCENLSFVEKKTNELLMKNLLLSLPKKFTAAAAPNSKDGAANADGSADKSNQPALETSKDPAALAAMLQSIIKAEGSETTYQLDNLLGQSPAAPIAHLGVHAPVVGYQKFHC